VASRGLYSAGGRRGYVFDVIYIVVLAAFFALALAYAWAAPRI
jgi:hypothetical protein